MLCYNGLPTEFFAPAVEYAKTCIYSESAYAVRRNLFSVESNARKQAFNY